MRTTDPPGPGALASAPLIGPAALPPEGSQRAFWLAFALCACAALIPLWSVKYPPLVDLPQHAAQIAIWQHWDDPQWGFAGEYEFNWSTPYLIGYLIARPLAGVVGTLAALKATLSLGILLLPLALLALLRRSGGDRWWSLTGFAFAYNFSFHWGFVNFVVAIPLAILYVVLAWDVSRKYTWKRDVALALGLVVLYAAHLIALGVAGLVAAAVLAVNAPNRRAALLRIAILASSLPVVMWWLQRTVAGAPDAQMRTAWGAMWQRPAAFFGATLGSPHDVLAALACVTLLLAIAIARPRVSRSPGRLVPCAVSAVVFLLSPSSVLGTYLVYQRFAVFALLLGLFALEAPADRQLRRRSRQLLIAVVLVWSVVLTVRFQRFDAVARKFDAIIDAMQPARRVRSLAFDPESPEAPGTQPFLHFPAWYQAAKGGHLDYSFAMIYPQLIRYTRQARPQLGPNVESQPGTYDDAKEGARYDYIVVRSSRDETRRLFGRTPRGQVALKQRSGEWWLYERRAEPAGGDGAVR